MPPYLPTFAYQEGCKWRWLLWMPNVLGKQYKMFWCSCGFALLLFCYEKSFWEIHSLLITEIQYITYSHPKFILLRNDNMYLYNDHLFFMDRINCFLSSGMFNDNCCSSIVFFSHLSVKGTFKKNTWEYRHYPSPTILTYSCFVLYIFVNFKLGQIGTSIH